MADCNITEVFFAERERMCSYYQTTISRCSHCKLSVNNNGEGFECAEFTLVLPQKAIEMVQQWSDSHPRKTRQSEFLKQFPRSRVTADGTLDLLPCSVDTELKDRCDGFVGCYSCGRAYWLEEVD